jgi:hypothetical protein
MTSRWWYEFRPTDDLTAAANTWPKLKSLKSERIMWLSERRHLCKYAVKVIVNKIENDNQEAPPWSYRNGSLRQVTRTLHNPAQPQTKLCSTIPSRNSFSGAKR